MVDQDVVVAEPNTQSGAISANISLAGLKIGNVTAADRADEGQALEIKNLSVYYGNFRALRNINVGIGRHRITSIIGPSGCGKSTLIRCLNRMNDLIPSFHAEGEVLFEGENLYGRDIDPVEVRQRIGMVFQKPNPFPKSIYDNVTFGVKINGIKGRLDEIVERSLRSAALWD